MKAADSIPIILLSAVFGFVALQAKQASDLTATSQAAAIAAPHEGTKRAMPRPEVSASESAAAAVASPATDHVADAASTAPAEPAAPERDLVAIRRRIESAEQTTYIGEILRERDSSLARWPDRQAQPIHVWVGKGDRLTGWQPDFPVRVREAFESWQSLGIPVRFTFVVDSADADVHVSWIDHFAEPISGKTLWARDRNWWIINGNITLALHHNEGEMLDEKAIHAIALHEVGHLLGLDHTLDTANIMTARVRVRDLSEADKTTMRLLYSLPPGSVR